MKMWAVGLFVVSVVSVVSLSVVRANAPQHPEQEIIASIMAAKSK